MLVLFYLIVSRVVVPTIVAYAQALFEPVMIVVIIFIGMVVIFGALGMPISHNLGSTIAGSVFKGMGRCFTGLYRVIRWFVRSTGRLLRRVFNGTLRGLRAAGMNAIGRNIIACLACILVLAIII